MSVLQHALKKRKLESGNATSATPAKSSDLPNNANKSLLSYFLKSVKNPPPLVSPDQPLAQNNLQNKNKNLILNPQNLISNIGNIDWCEDYDNDEKSRSINENINDTIWEKRCKPKRVEDVIGHEKVKILLENWLLNNDLKNSKGGKKAMIICGPSGCGKTSLIECILSKHNYKIMDQIDEDSNDTLANNIQSVLYTRSLLNDGVCSKNNSSKKKNAIVIDCIEGLSPQNKKNLVSLLKTHVSNVPIILTCDDLYDSSLRSFKEAGYLLQMYALQNRDLILALTKASSIILPQPLSIQGAETLLNSSHGNLRHAINAMQFMVSTKHRCNPGSGALQETDKPYNLFSNTLQICCGVSDINSEGLASSDFDLSIAMLQHNLLNALKTIEKTAFALDCLTLSDVLSKQYFSEKFAVFIAIKGTSISCKNSAAAPKIEFPHLYSKMLSKKSRFNALTSVGSFFSRPKPGVTFVPSNTTLFQINPCPLVAHEIIEVRRQYYVNKKNETTKELLKEKILVEDNENANILIKKYNIWNF